MKTTIKALLVITTFAFFACNKTDNTIGIDSTATDLSVSQLKSASLTVNDVAVEAVAQAANFETDFYAGYEQMLRQLAHVKGKKGNLLMGQGHFHYIESQVPVVSIVTAATVTGYPITISIDYGTGIKTNHDHIISGMVTIEINGDKNTEGSTRTITFTECKIDLIEIDGTTTDTFNGDNTLTRKITCDSDVTFTLADGTILDWVGTNVRDWIAGVNTPKEHDDDQIQITGRIDVTSTGKDSITGIPVIDNYSRVISADNPIIRLGDCKYPVQGTVDLVKNDLLISSLDYGDGTCDNMATMTTNGATVDIELQGQGKCKMPKAKTKGKHKGMEKGEMHDDEMHGGGMGNGKGK
jgi:hypothetical protein